MVGGGAYSPPFPALFSPAVGVPGAGRGRAAGAGPAGAAQQRAWLRGGAPCAAGAGGRRPPRPPPHRPPGPRRPPIGPAGPGGGGAAPRPAHVSPAPPPRPLSAFYANEMVMRCSAPPPPIGSACLPSPAAASGPAPRRCPTARGGTAAVGRGRRCRGSARSCWRVSGRGALWGSCGAGGGVGQGEVWGGCGAEGVVGHLWGGCGGTCGDVGRLWGTLGDLWGSSGAAVGQQWSTWGDLWGTCGAVTGQLWVAWGAVGGCGGRGPPVPRPIAPPPPQETCGPTPRRRGRAGPMTSSMMTTMTPPSGSSWG